MPRVASGGQGLTLPGIYRELLVLEEEKHAHFDPRMACDDPGEAPARYRRPDSLVRALRAGKTVLVQRAMVRHAAWRLTGVKADPLPWHRTVQVVQVTPGDVVTASDREIPWYGCGVDEFVGGLR